jgi:hypothetical protein
MMDLLLVFARWSSKFHITLAARIYDKNSCACTLGSIYFKLSRTFAKYEDYLLCKYAALQYAVVESTINYTAATARSWAIVTDHS